MRVTKYVLLCVMLSPVYAQSPWASDVPLMMPETGTPTASVASVAAQANGGYYAVLERSDGRREILRYDVRHQLLSRQRRPSGSFIDGPDPTSLLSILDDGSLFSLYDTNRFALHDPEGRVQWSNDSPFFRCSHAVAAAGPILWMSCGSFGNGYGLLRFDEVGRIGVAQSAQFGGTTSLLLARDGGVYNADYGTDLANAVVQLSRFDPAGLLRWQVQPTAQAEYAVGAMFELDDGHVLLLGNLFGQTRLRLLEYDSEGLLVATDDVDIGIEASFIRVAQLSPDGSLQLIAASVGGGSDTLVQIGVDRSLDWTHALPSSTYLVATQLKRGAWLRTDGGETRLIAQRRTSADADARMVYSFIAVNAEGERLATVELGDDRAFRDFEPRSSEGDFISAGRLGRVDAEGQFHALPLPNLDAEEQPKVLAAQVDGPERFVVVDRVAGRELQAWDRHGELRWRTALDRPLPFDATLVTWVNLQVSAQTLCVATVDSAGRVNDVRRAECLGREQGESLLSFSPAAHVYSDVGTDNRSHLLLGGDILAYIDATETGRHVRFRSLLDGTAVRPPVALNPGLDYRLYGQAGGAGMALSSSVGTSAFWFDGQLPDARDYETVAGEVAVLAQGLLDGQNWLPRQGDSASELADGPVWSLQVNDAALPVVISGLDGDGVHRLWGFDPASGNMLWRTVTEGDPWTTRLDRAALADAVWLFEHNEKHLALRLIKRATGTISDRRSYECASDPCQFFTDGRAASAEGLDLLLLRQQDHAPSALRSLHLVQPAPAVRADQPGVAGLWYHPGLQGQGFVLSYVAETRTLFAPWFTYGTSSEQGDESSLRWLTLHGRVEAGADVAALDILRNANGQFAAPPATGSAVIGQAELRFASCDRATLMMSFDRSQSSMASMAIPLVRLGPRTSPCIRADDTVQPALLELADESGFSIRQSGAWFDPTSSGQGLMVEVVPPGKTQSGLLFAAWFTYDPSFPGNDEHLQDWFVLQSDLGSAANGRVTVPIYRSVGGTALGRPTGNLYRVGEAEVQFEDCERLTVTYRFDTQGLAAVHAGLAGDLSLQRIGGCSAN